MRPNAESVACGEFSCKAANPDLGEYVNGFCACTCADSMYMVNALGCGTDTNRIADAIMVCIALTCMYVLLL